MSEAEKKRRLDYKENRKKWILIQIIIIAVITALLLAWTITYQTLNKTLYIDYTEQSEIDYQVVLKPNEFYEESILEAGQAYVASLIDSVIADFTYQLDMQTSGVNYAYTYSINAQLFVRDSKGTVVFNPTYELVPKTQGTQSSSNNLKIEESVAVDYETYNALAQKFVDTYELRDMDCSLVVSLCIDVTGACDAFEADAQNTYTTSLSIPLTSKTANVQMTASVPNGESKVLACDTDIDETVFLVLAIIFAVLDVLAVAFLIGFIYLTRNEDINYNIKIKKLLSSYGSYIQRLQSDFDTEGYQLVWLTTFNDMLSIRDTIQSPILMKENDDQTCSQFMIPTNTQILYMFEIKIDNYDLIYGEDLEEEVVEEEIQEIFDMNGMTNDDLQEALDSPTVPLEDIDYVDVQDQEVDNGVEVIGVVWPERAHKNKIYRYDPDGHTIEDGDIVLVPTHDAARGRTVIRKAAVAHGNHRVDPQTFKHPLKKIIGIVKRKAENVLSGSDNT